MLVSRTPGRIRRPRGTRSYSPSMLFRWIPVPGTITPEPEPVEVEHDAALPSASTAETCVVPPTGAAAVEVAREPRASRPCLLAHHLDQRRQPVGAARAADPDPVEQLEPV